MNKQILAKGRVPLACALLITAGLLAGCNDKDKASSGPAGASAPGPAAATTSAASTIEQTKQAQIKAHNAYVKAYNTLIDDNRSVAAHFKSYRKMEVNSKSPNGLSFYGSPESLNGTLGNLRKAREVGSGDAGLDGAVDGVLSSGAKLVAVWTPLHPYYNSKEFLEDKFAKARAADADMTAGFEGLLAAIEQMGSELDRISDAQRQEEMAKLKAQGDMLSFYGSESMWFAKKLVKKINELESLKDKKGIAAVDAEAVQLGQSLEGFAKAIEQGKLDPKIGEEGVKPFTALADRLQDMLGQWRVFKNGGHESTLNVIFGYYNHAVRASENLKR